MTTPLSPYGIKQTARTALTKCCIAVCQFKSIDQATEADFRVYAALKDHQRTSLQNHLIGTFSAEDDTHRFEQNRNIVNDGPILGIPDV